MKERGDIEINKMKEGEGEQREREWGMKGYRDKQERRDIEINKMKERWKGYRDKQDERGRRGAERERGGG